MKWIALAAVAGVVLLQLLGAVPDSSVGGPMMLFFAFMLAALAAGIHEAWTMKRGVMGWIVSIVAALAGAIVAGLVGGSLVDTVMGVAAQVLDIQGSLAETKHPLLYILSAAMMLLMLFGSWLALQIVNRMR
jgi:hypothetical protein